MVGMRFQPAENIREALTSHTRLVNLKIEDNECGLNGKAVAVYFEGRKVGFIRNKDLSTILVKSIEYTQYKISDVYANYWVLRRTISPVLTKTQPPKEETPKNITTPEFKIEPKKETKMNISSNMRDSFFREIKNVAIDFQSGKFGIVSTEGISVYSEGGVSVNPITEFGIKVPAFAMRIAVSELKEGDIIINGTDSSFFKGLTENGYEVVSLNGEVKQVGNVANLFFGKNSVLAVKNMFSGAGGMNPMMMALMLGDGKDFDMKTFAMMSMMGGGQMDNNMLMMMAMMGK